MAVLKHISVKGSNGGDALNYVLYKHNEKTGELLVDGRGNPVMRDEYYLDGINCEPYSFAAECKAVNDLFGKNQLPGDIKAHHFIISYDPKDGLEHGLTGPKAQQLSMEWAERCLPGFQILVCTHMDGSNESGNIHTHIMMNSVRKYDTRLDDFGERTIDHLAGYKLNLTNNHLQFMKQELMDLCGREGLYQIDLLSPAKDRITDKEYRVQQNGQNHFEKHHSIYSDETEKTVFQTQKQYLRESVVDVAKRATSFDEFCEIMNTEYNITVKESRGRISYLHPDREKYITGRSLGADYEKKAILAMLSSERTISDNVDRRLLDLHGCSPTLIESIEDCEKVFAMNSELKMVVRLQVYGKNQMNACYANTEAATKVKEMARIILFIQGNGFDSVESIREAMSSTVKTEKYVTAELNKKQNNIKSINEDIHFMGQYLVNKKFFIDYKRSEDPANYIKEYRREIRDYKEAETFIKNKYQGTGFPLMKQLKEKKNYESEQVKQLKRKKEKVLIQKNMLKTSLKYIEETLVEKPNGLDAPLNNYGGTKTTDRKTR